MSISRVGLRVSLLLIEPVPRRACDGWEVGGWIERRRWRLQVGKSPFLLISLLLTAGCASMAIQVRGSLWDKQGGFSNESSLNIWRVP